VIENGREIIPKNTKDISERRVRQDYHPLGNDGEKKCEKVKGVKIEGKEIGIKKC